MVDGIEIERVPPVDAWEQSFRAWRDAVLAENRTFPQFFDAQQRFRKLIYPLRVNQLSVNQEQDLAEDPEFFRAGMNATGKNAEALRAEIREYFDRVHGS